MGALAHLPRAQAAPFRPIEPARRLDESPLDAAYRILRSGAHVRAHPLLDRARSDAARLVVGGGYGAAAQELAATSFVATVVSELAAGADLEQADTRIAVDALAEVCELPLDTAAFALFERVVTSQALLELPPTAAAEIQLTLPLHLGVLAGVVVWQHDGGELRPLLALGDDVPLGRARRAAVAAVRERERLRLVGGELHAAAVRRFGAPVGALVGERGRGDPDAVQVYLEVAARALGAVLERELLLDRGAERELALTQSLEKRLMRVGFDLHDGPVQDVLALGVELRLLGRELYPFVADSHRELVAGRFDDLVARVEDVNGALREIAHTLESRSITSRPLGETLHRLVDEFGARSGIESRLEVTGDPESLTAAQRIAVFRAVQESLTNAREHSGASAVRVSLRARRSSIDVQVSDDGKGFDVERALARAAQRGRLGLIGMGERVRMLGGTFEIDSRPGGPTVLRFSLPRTVAG